MIDGLPNYSNRPTIIVLWSWIPGARPKNYAIRHDSSSTVGGINRKHARWTKSTIGPSASILPDPRHWDGLGGRSLRQFRRA